MTNSQVNVDGPYTWTLLAEVIVQALSRTLIDLYEAAETVPINFYPRQVLRLIWPLLKFDGAVLGMQKVSINGTLEINIEQAYVHQRDSSILDEYALLSLTDRLTEMFNQGLDWPLSCNCAELCRANKLLQLVEFSETHASPQLLLYGIPPTPLKVGGWVLLFRRNDDPFGTEQEEYLMALWPHLARSTMFNRTVQLNRRLERREGNAAALLNYQGWIEVADPYFLQLLAMEWQDYKSDKVPEQVLHCWQQGIDYKGKFIYLSMQVQNEYLVCHGAKKTGWHDLTNAERVVASQYAVGASYKQIADSLSVSQNTVRSHIKHIYDKLQIHDKAELANMWARNSEGSVALAS
jgi:DNA-binding CsgD family transcriptional regulator